MQPSRVVVLAAGVGSRLESKVGAKPLMRVGGMTLLERSIVAAHEAGFDDVVVVTGHEHERVAREALDVSRRRGLRVVVVHNARYREGNGLSVLAARDVVGDAPFALVMSDLLRRSTPITVGQVLARELTAAATSGGTTIASRHMLEVLAATHERARREGRPTVRGLGSPGRRARSLASAVQVLQARGLACSAPDGSALIDPDAVLADVVVQRLAQEDRAVWQRDATTPDP